MAQRIRFGDFELNVASYELRRRGRPVHVERLPMDLLLLLVSRPGDLVTREDIVAKLWGEDVFLDTENAINTAVRKLRQALHDHPKNPTFVQTVPAKGYRFAAPLRSEATAANTDRVMLAVLPFENLTGDANMEYFSDGLTEETIATLGRVSPAEMGVIARTSSMAYKRTTKSVRQIGGELRVDYVVESSVRADADRLRVTVQLIRVDDQTHLWAETYERTANRLLSIQDELGRAIAEKVRIHLPLAGAVVSRRHTVSADAYDLYLRGRFYWNQRTRAALERSIGYFEQALELDPNYALAHSGVADCYAMLPITSDAATRECLPRASGAARSAVAADATCAEAHASVAACKFWMEWDWESAEAEARQAIALQPNYALAHLLCAHILSNSERHEEAEEEIRAAAELDPASTHMRAIYAQLLFQARRYEAAMAQARKALVLNPDAWIANIVTGKLHIQYGRFDEAQHSLQRAFDLSGGNTEALGLRGYAHAKAGTSDQARDVLTTLADMAKHRYVPPYNIALVYAGLGEVDSVVRELRKAYEERDVRLVFLPVDPKWDEFRADARIRALYPNRPPASVISRPA